MFGFVKNLFYREPSVRISPEMAMALAYSIGHKTPENVEFVERIRKEAGAGPSRIICADAPVKSMKNDSVIEVADAEPVPD
ncbi:MAG: hypothetical protein LBR88_07365 [Zoogloeaceae bacterium]|jgi:hypothetical protein|nr:hypothetical protein [Zoogloeaceae bacterium]